MPKPNTRPAIFPQLKFVTNYLLAGCGPERDLIFELNTDAAVGLLVLFVVPTADDIVQAFFDPRKGRTSTPRRHGRKRPLPQGIPRVGYLVGDVWEVDSIGKGLQKLPGGRWLLPGINIYEGIALSAAVLEGVSDLAYDNFAGLLDLNPN